MIIKKGFALVERTEHVSRVSHMCTVSLVCSFNSLLPSELIKEWTKLYMTLCGYKKEDVLLNVYTYPSDSRALDSIELAKCKIKLVEEMLLISTKGGVNWFICFYDVDIANAWMKTIGSKPFLMSTAFMFIYIYVYI
jgi:hypothetical protein